MTCTWQDRPGAVELTLELPRIQVPALGPPYHTWILPDGTSWIQFYRTTAGYLLRFPDLADFQVSLDGQSVTCFPAPDISEVTTQHLYLNQVLPLALSKRGKLVFHASAVEIGDGAVAFVAESRRGKSTLAASFATNGFRFITDDGLVLSPGVEGFEILPNHPSLRLRQDSQDALLPSADRRAPSLDYKSKARYLAGEDLPFCDERRSLRRVYFLGDGSAACFEIRPLTAIDTLFELVKHGFLLDIQESQGLVYHFENIARLANQGFHYRLDYPRRFDELKEVRQAIVAHTLQKS